MEMFAINRPLNVFIIPEQNIKPCNIIQLGVYLLWSCERADVHGFSECH